MPYRYIGASMPPKMAKSASFGLLYGAFGSNPCAEIDLGVHDWSEYRPSGLPIDYRMSALDELVIEVEAEGWREWFASLKGRWCIMQMRWKLEDELQAAETPRRNKDGWLTKDWMRIRELRQRMRDLDRWVADPRRMFRRYVPRNSYRSLFSNAP